MKTIPLLLAALGFAASTFAAEPAAPAKDTTYPLKTCVVSGETLGEMGAPYVYTYKHEGQPDREVRFCCKMCVARFEKNPTAYLAKLDAATTAANSDPAACCADEGCADGSCEHAAAGKTGGAKKAGS